MRGEWDPVCVVAGAELTATVWHIPVYADEPPAGPRLRRHGRSRSLAGPVHRVRVEARRGTESPAVDEHVRAGLHAPAPWPRVADVLLVPGGGCADGPAAASHPGALVVAAYRGERCRLRYGGRVLGLHSAVTTADAPGPGRRWHALASAVHAWVAAGLLADTLPGPVRLRTMRLPAGHDAPVTAAPPA